DLQRRRSSRGFAGAFCSRRTRCLSVCRTRSLAVLPPSSPQVTYSRWVVMNMGHPLT
ncbi:unnamed protein product, partial [Musa banksii]